ncbi:hypothetical protein GGR51DRAFT_569969 [Nemania sp. FL0031]|nr:hypothetical protein GGR51DRAFT_569969 [Nemania sp. FL0031]
MSPEIMYTIIFGTLASVIAIATMIQSYLQRQQPTQVRGIEAQAPWYRYRAYRSLAAIMPPIQLQRPNRAVLRPQRPGHLDELRTPRGRLDGGHSVAST